MQIVKTVDITSVEEARRQLTICNACRYCEGFCSVFPAAHRERDFPADTIEQLANLCHNCRGCFYACQYATPHEFQLNLPNALARVRQERWQANAFPRFLSVAFHRNGLLVALVVFVSAILFLGLVKVIAANQALVKHDDFYGVIPHNLMIAVFIPAFLLPVITVYVGLKRYWRQVGGEAIRWSHLKYMIASVAKMKNLTAGHGEGCNYEDEDKFSQARRLYHQATMYGFLLCFLATSVATLIHYIGGVVAPYNLLSLPKLLGIAGGLLLCVGTLGLGYLKVRADRTLADERVWSGEMAFIVVLFAVSFTGLLLYLFRETAWMPNLLILHLATVLSFFVLTPYSKMVHGFYRVAALLREEQIKHKHT